MGIYFISSRIAYFWAKMDNNGQFAIKLKIAKWQLAW